MDYNPSLYGLKLKTTVQDKEHIVFNVMLLPKNNKLQCSHFNGMDKTNQAGQLIVYYHLVAFQQL